MRASAAACGIALLAAALAPGDVAAQSEVEITVDFLGSPPQSVWYRPEGAGDVLPLNQVPGLPITRYRLRVPSASATARAASIEARYDGALANHIDVGHIWVPTSAQPIRLEFDRRKSAACNAVAVRYISRPPPTLSDRFRAQSLARELYYLENDNRCFEYQLLRKVALRWLELSRQLHATLPYMRVDPEAEAAVRALDRRT